MLAFSALAQTVPGGEPSGTVNNGGAVDESLRVQAEAAVNVVLSSATQQCIIKVILVGITTDKNILSEQEEA